MFPCDGQFAAINPAVCKEWGFAPEELVGARLVQHVHPEDVEKTLEALKKNIAEKGELALENRMVRKDGKIVDMLWSQSVFWFRLPKTDEQVHSDEA